MIGVGRHLDKVMFMLEEGEGPSWVSRGDKRILGRKNRFYEWLGGRELDLFEEQMSG